MSRAHWCEIGTGLPTIAGSASNVLLNTDGQTSQFPEIRLRFMPAKGLIYGPNATADGKPAPDKEEVTAP